ncbi:YdcF family protein [Nocardia sp. NPDC058519]|uniref:YdcF family protein n=1 Tax=unclassified Nocardia TaxID=2637762 RepID=UPI0036554E71
MVRWTWRKRVVCAAIAVTGLACVPVPAGADSSAPPGLDFARALGTPALPGIYGPDTAVVVLGYGLTPEGTMREELVRRLRAGLAQAVFAPWSPIIVTGGNPQAGMSEADAMADWLVAAGIDQRRILRESEADSTVANAGNTAAMMAERGLRSVVLVTSEDHIARARGAFAAAGVLVVGDHTPDRAQWDSVPLHVGVFGPAPHQWSL